MAHGQAMYLGVDRSTLEVELTPDARVLLLGGEPFAEEIVMWWNFVARSHDEIDRARSQWNAGGDDRASVRWRTTRPTSGWRRRRCPTSGCSPAVGSRHGSSP